MRDPMMVRRDVRWGAVAAVVLTTMTIAGCSSSKSKAGSSTGGATSAAGSSTSAAASTSAAGSVTFGLISQVSVAPYFVTEANGAKAEAQKLGVKLTVVDAGQDSSKDITLTQTLITSGVKGLAIVPSNTDIGPRVSKLTQAAKIPLVASDSPLKDSSGKSAPFVGLDNTGSGVQVGQILGREFNKRGWSASDTYYADVQAPTLQVCMLRTNASLSTFSKAVPSFSSGHVVKLPYDGSVAKATDSMRAAITAHPQAKHWVLSSCNDDGVVGALKALQGKGFKAANALGIGLGGDLACTAYTDAYTTTGMPISTYLDAGRIGATVVQTLYNIVVKKQTVTGNVFVPTPEITKANYAQHAKCSK
jgi:L-arabinose transport system substrate-binding protein